MADCGGDRRKSRQKPEEKAEAEALLLASFELSHETEEQRSNKV